MPVTRKFLDWNRPALPAAAAFLLDTYSMMGAADLSGVIVVLPGSRAGRRLLELLVAEADRRIIRLTPPTIVTVGRLPEHLYEPRRKFATDLINKFAWTAALRKLDPAAVRSIVPDPPGEKDFSRWLSFGELLWKQHRELAAEGLDFLDVASRGAELKSFDESERWKLLRTVQESCLAQLDELELWDLQSARLFAIRHEECRAEADIVLIGTADLNRATREMLEQVQDRVTALVHAPKRLSRRFDEFGCIVPETWDGPNIDIKSEQIRVVEGPADQADAVVETLAAYNGRYCIDDVTIGMTDERLVPEVTRQLAEQRVDVRWVAGMNLSESRPFRLLAAVSEFLENPRFDSFASLIRHTDLDIWLARQPVRRGDENEVFEQVDQRPQTLDSETLLKHVDDYFNRHLPAEPGDWLSEEADSSVAGIRHIHDCVQALLAPLKDERPRRPLGEWVDPLTALIMNVYSDVEFDLETEAGAYTLKACRDIHELLVTHSDIPEPLMPTVSAAQAIRLLLDELRSAAVPPLPNDDALEMLGWLELPLDDSPALVVTTFNEGFVPSSLNSDAFLPNALRRHMGLLDNRRRYARDAYALSVLAHSRQQLQLIVAKRDQRSDPLKPSRLLFATDPEEAARRVVACFGESEAPPREALALSETSSTPADTERQLRVPRPQPLKRPVERLSVTAFRTYLACPYRFYLRHILRLKDVDDLATELDALMFGNLMHEVLSRFADGPARDSQDSEFIRDNLRQLLDECVDDLLGKSRLAAVNVQIMQLQWRLDAFAEWQARWSADGWRIIHNELSFADQNCQLTLPDGRSIKLDGRIDRIDQFQNTDRYIIFDYKSSENVRKPNEAHRKKDEWVDLQLPLYRHLGQHIGLTGEIDLGYIVLPKDTKKVQHLIADWEAGDLREAENTATRVVENILNEEFWPPADPDPILFPEFAAICQDGAFDREAVA